MNTMKHSDLPTWVSLSHTHHGEDSGSIFRTSVEVTGNLDRLPSADIYRFACYYFLSHLGDARIKEACLGLSHIYQYQIDLGNIPVNDTSFTTPKYIKNAKVRNSTLPPLEIAD